MSELLLPGSFWRESEFVDGLTGACGPNALAMAWSWASQQYHSTVDIYQAMYAQGLCDANGVSNINGLESAASRFGLAVTDFRPYAAPWPDWSDWFLRALQAGSCVLMETSVGQALADAISGRAQDATDLHYHFLVVVGRNDGGYSPHAGINLPAGWWAADGDNLAAGDRLQFYPDSEMQAAGPCAALDIGQVKGSLTMVLVRTADGGATDPSNGRKVGGGLADFIWARGYENEHLSVGERQYGPDDVTAATTAHVLYWNIPKHWPTDTLGGEVLRSIFEQYDAAMKDIVSLQAQLREAQQQIAQLQHGGAGGVVTATSAQATQALQLMQSLKSLLGTI